tara:strand:+ start:606 stop:1130 length:525 start_codon:yes stop_codon:yes gene_type:complete
MIKFIVIKVVFFFYLLFLTSNIYANEISFINLNKIMNDSIVGQYINNKIKIEKNKILEEFKNTEKTLKDNENKILSQKNLLKIEEYNKKVANLKNDVANYNSQRKKILSQFKIKQNKVSQEVISQINIILTEYMKDKSISLIIRKKDIIVAKTELDITDEIIVLLDKKIKEIKF